MKKNSSRNPGIGLIFVTLIAGAAVAAPVAQVRRIEGDAELLRAGSGEPIPLEVGVGLTEDDRIYTGMDSAVELVFADASVVKVNELTDMKIAAFRPGDDAVRTRLWLKAGEVSAEVTHGGQTRSDFQIRTPTATCSVRGTFFMVRHVDGVTLQHTNEGLVDTVSHQTGATVQSHPGDRVEHNDQGESHTPHDHRNNQGNTRTLPGGSTRHEDRAAGRDRLTQSGGVAPGQGGSIGGNEFIRGTLTDVTGDVVRNRGGGTGGGLPGLGPNVLSNPSFAGLDGSSLARWVEVERARPDMLPIGGVTVAGLDPVDNRVALLWTPSMGTSVGSASSLDHGGAIFQTFTPARSGSHRLIVDYNFFTEEFIRPMGNPIPGDDVFDVFVFQPDFGAGGGPQQVGGNGGSSPDLGTPIFATHAESVSTARLQPGVITVPGVGADAFEAIPVAQQTGPQRFISNDFDLVAGTTYVAGARVVNRDVAGNELRDPMAFADNTGTTAVAIDRLAVHEIIPAGDSSGTVPDSGGDAEIPLPRN